MSNFLDVEGGLQVLPLSVVTALAVGVVVTVVSSLVPAWRASRVPPVAAMRDVAVDTTGRSLVRLLIGAVLLGIGALLGGTGAAAEEVANVGYGVALAFVGVLFVAPGLARPVSRLLGWPLGKARGITGSLAKDNATRNPRRTASTGLALTIGIGIVAFFLVLNASVRSSFDKIVDDNFVGDFTVQAPGQGFLGLPEDLGPAVAEVDDVDEVTSMQFADATVDGSREAILGTSVSLFQLFGLETEGSTGLEPGELVMRQDAADSAGIGLGDQVTVGFVDAAPAVLTVAGIYEGSPARPFGDYIVGQEELAQHVPRAATGMLVVELASGAVPEEAREEIDGVVEDLAPAAELQDNDDLKESIASDLDTVVQLVVLALAAGFLGIGAALWPAWRAGRMNVLEAIHTE